jgi:phosphatidylserine decarboxylase
MSEPLKYWDRYEGKIKEDQVYADWFVKWCYENPLGKKLLDYVFSKKNFNFIYGLYKNSKLSLKQIQKDIHDYAIDMDLYENGPFNNYTDFFLRKFKKGVRPFDENPRIMSAFAEGRVLAYEEITPTHQYPVKGAYLSADKLLNDKSLAQEFMGGPIVIIRLCPIDYHHFHFPDNGKILKSWKVGGVYHSVNVLALKHKGDIFIDNEREITLMQTENFGKLAYIEVGAMCVGKIIQEDPNLTEFEKGQLKGHFEFGASTVILLGEKGKWKPSEDIIIHSIENRESFIKLGDEIGSKL